MNSKYQKSLRLLERAKQVIPSASQTYSKGYKYYCEGASPVFLDHGKNGHVWDIDGNEYIDTVLGLGAISIGYNNKRVNNAIEKQLKKGIGFTLPTVLEVELAEKFSKLVSCAEMVRFVKNGSDATTAAVRLARAYTKRDLILSAGYHGWHDWSIGVSENNRGVPFAVQKLTAKFSYNDLEALNTLMEKNRGEIAAVIMEPVELEVPKPGYLEAVRELTKKHGALLIFDEVYSGFRICPGGAHSYFGVHPDLACFGKAIGNGTDISAVVGKKEIMKLIDEGVFISMTFAGNALPLAASLATIKILETKGSFEKLWKLESKLIEGINEQIKSIGLSDIAFTTRFPAHTALLFKPLNDKISALDLQSCFQQKVLNQGVLYLGIHNFCLEHTEADIQKVLNVYKNAFQELKQVIGSKQIHLELKGEKIRPVFIRN